MVAFAIFGNTGLYMELNKIVPVSDILETKGAEAAIISIYQGLPMSGIALLAISIITLIFLSATLDSSSYTLANVASRKVSVDEEPARSHKLVWALAIEVVAFSMMFSGGLHALQSVVVITSVPLVLIMAMSAISLVRWLKEDEEKNRVHISDIDATNNGHVERLTS